MMMRNQVTPNYVNKLKMKKIETEKKKHKKILNLIISIKPEEEIQNY